MSQSNSEQSPSNIEHKFDWVDELTALYARIHEDHVYSDVIIVVDGQEFYLHRMVLAMRSDYFESMLYGGMKESQQYEIVIHDVSPQAFTYLIQYIYTGRIPLATLHVPLIMEILILADQYRFQLLETAISHKLIKILTMSNVCCIFNGAHMLSDCKLLDTCIELLDFHALEILQHESFLELSQASVIELLGRDSFFAPEIDVFRGVLRWCTHTNEDLNDMVKKCVRLPLINEDDLLKVVRPTALFTDSTILNVLANNMSNINSLPYRGRLLPNVNVATADGGAKVVVGESPECLLDGYVATFTYHDITGPTDKGIVIKLTKPFIINHIRMVIHDKYVYQYFIEVSMDMKNWVRVIDYSQYPCRRWQWLYFDKRAIQYIRIVGVEDKGETFKLVFLEAMCQSKIPLVVDNIVCPDSNIATLYSASILSGLNKKVLLNGDMRDYTLRAGYTFHVIGAGQIEIVLNQPYVISTMRLLLLDVDARTYSYSIELSRNGDDWEMAVDKRTEKCKSWQILRFRARPVLYIRITGTFSSATKTLQCVHFECSACADDVSSMVPATSVVSAKRKRK